MAVSLEVRMPYLDHRVAAIAARIPLGFKLRGVRGKHILRRLLYREAPEALFKGQRRALQFRSANGSRGR